MPKQWTLDQTIAWVKWRDMATVEELADRYISTLIMFPPDNTQNVDTLTSLKTALLNGVLIAKGRKNGEGDREIIQVGSWQDLEIHIPHLQNASAQSKGAKGTCYYDIVFPIDEVQHYFKQDGTSKLQKRKRRKGQGRIDDTKHLQEMNKLILKGMVTSPNAAAKKIAKEAKGASYDAIVARLRRKYRAQYS